MFSSDDFEDDNYDDWKPMFDFFGYKFTLFGAQSQLSADAGKMTGAELREMYDEGFEIGSHSRYHSSPQGIVWASLDSIADDVERSWLADSLSAYGSTVPESAVRGFAYPLHNFDIRSYNALISEGFHPYWENWWPHGHMIGWEHSFVHEFHHFFGAIVNNTDVAPYGATFVDGYRNAVICDAIVKSSQTKQAVDIRY